MQFKQFAVDLFIDLSLGLNFSEFRDFAQNMQNPRNIISAKYNPVKVALHPNYIRIMSKYLGYSNVGDDSQLALLSRHLEL